MEQAKSYVCTSCLTPVPRGHKFCGRCGAPVPDDVMEAQTRFFSVMQDPEKARLILIRGDGLDGLSFHLKAEQHILGRTGQLEFPDDAFISPRHANFFYRNGRLVVRDESSLNGVYRRIRERAPISPGDTFLAGDQIFRLDATTPPESGVEDGTYFYASPRFPVTFSVTQMLEGNREGLTSCARGATLDIGRENVNLNIPLDGHVSGLHCTVEQTGGEFTLVDRDSRNGTYVRIQGDTELDHGDYLFMGRKLLRVELMNS